MAAMAWSRRTGRVLAIALMSGVVALAGCVHEDESNEPLADGEGEPLGERLEWVEVATGLDRPTDATHAGDGSGDLYVAEQSGVVRLLSEDGLQEEPVLDIRERVGTDHFEEGLLGIAFAPGYPEDPRVFISYTDDERHSVLSWFPRSSADEEPLRLDADNEKVLLRLEQPYGNHNGGQIRFGPDGLLWFSLGDGGSGGDPHGNAQDPHTLLGSLLRIDVQAQTDSGGYTVPEDNPFSDGEAGAPEVWAYGLRNPWRFSFDRETGDLWIGDVGQDRFEEVNFVPAGEGAGWNFGWNRFEGNDRFSDTPVEDPVDPVAVYPLEGRDHCAVTGGFVYRGEAIPAMQGVYVFADWCSGVVWGLERSDDEWVMGTLMESGRQPSAFAEDEAGELYLVDHGGALLRLQEH